MSGKERIVLYGPKRVAWFVLEVPSADGRGWNAAAICETEEDCELLAEGEKRFRVRRVWGEAIVDLGDVVRDQDGPVREGDDEDGECFRGGEAAAYEREQQIEAMRHK